MRIVSHIFVQTHQNKFENAKKLCLLKVYMFFNQQGCVGQWRSKISLQVLKIYTREVVKWIKYLLYIKLFYPFFYIIFCQKRLR